MKTDLIPTCMNFIKANMNTLPTKKQQDFIPNIRSIKDKTIKYETCMS